MADSRGCVDKELLQEVTRRRVSQERSTIGSRSAAADWKPSHHRRRAQRDIAYYVTFYASAQHRARLAFFYRP